LSGEILKAQYIKAIYTGIRKKPTIVFILTLNHNTNNKYAENPSRPQSSILILVAPFTKSRSQD